jgi:hypothetical protein
MSDTEQFLDEMMPRIHEAETALHDGDAGPRFEMWSHTDPVTAFHPRVVGGADAGQLRDFLAAQAGHASFAAEDGQPGPLRGDASA